MTTRTFRRLHALLNRAMLTIAHPDRPPALLRIDPEQAAAAVQADGPEIWTPAAPAEQPDREQAAEPEPVHDELWSLLDWTLWGSGMGDVFREPLADTMTAAITPEQRQTALELIEAWHASGRQPLGRRRYEELNTELGQARAERDRLSRELADLKRWCETEGQERAAERKQHLARDDAINRVIALHQPRNHGGRTICGACSDYDPSSDSTDSTPVPHPCDTIHALDGTQQPTEADRA